MLLAHPGGPYFKNKDDGAWSIPKGEIEPGEDKAKDKNFWSVRVSKDIRLIVHKTQSSLLLCYVDHHDKAYDWAGRRKLETHPKTGAAQFVEIRETVQQVFPSYVEGEKPKRSAKKKPLFVQCTDEVLLGYGVPA